MATKKFRISPNPKSDQKLLGEMKKALSAGVWKIKDLSAMLHIGEPRLHRLLDTIVDHQDNDTKARKSCKKECGKQCKCDDRKAVPAGCLEDAGTMICVTHLPSPKMFPAFITYLTECIEKALRVLKG